MSQTLRRLLDDSEEEDKKLVASHPMIFGERPQQSWRRQGYQSTTTRPF